MDLNNIEEKMNKTISVLQENLSEVRAGRANPAILNKITVSYYGVPTPINQVAGISVPEARLIVIQPWDATLLKEIEKEILKAEIGINPNNDGKVIRLAFPELTEERRKELVKDIRKMGEESKVSVRAVRREGMDIAKAEQKDGGMTEDELKSMEDKIQKLTDKKVAEIDQMIENKEKEEDFFIPVKVMSKVFKGKFLEYMKKEKLEYYKKMKEYENPAIYNELMRKMYEKDWIVYCKEPFKNANSVIEYLGRYTHRVAISNERILKIEEGKVTFKWRDYKDGNKMKEMTVSIEEFIRRFLFNDSFTF